MQPPKKVSERIVSALKRLVPVIEQQAVRDVSEADTVTLVKDILADAFGYDKYAEITGELAIRGTFCDLAVKIDEKVTELIEVKAIGITLSDRHVKQAVDYAANQGIEWVILTNAAVWRLYHIEFAKPIDKRLVAEIELNTVDFRSEDALETLYLFTKEGFKRGAHVELRDRQEATSRYLLAALILYNDNVVASIRRELRRIVDILVSDDEIIHILREEVIKRDSLECPAADEARKRVERTESRRLRAAERSKPASVDPPTSTPPPDVP